LKSEPGCIIFRRLSCLAVNWALLFFRGVSKELK
jgi:hypothetical protein